MIWNDHSKLRGKHSLLSPSGPSWLNYPLDDPDQLFARYVSQYATEIGTLFHSFAEDRIRYRLKLNKAEKNSYLVYLLKNGIPRSVIDIDYIYPTVMMYVNDCIGFRMEPEVIVYYSDNCYGTVDAISVGKDYLRINDLKTGKTPAKIEQLKTYAALFCWEYKVKPSKLNIDLNLYQGGEILNYIPEPEEIEAIQHQIISLDKFVNQWIMEDTPR